MMDSTGTVLVVDDESSIRRALRGTLAALGFTADEASSGEQGLDLARHHRYDAVLLDINMPGKGGIETCRELRRQSPGLGILMLTVRDSENDKVEALDAGADDYITKPVVIRELTARMRAVRRGRSETSEPLTSTIRVGDLTLDPVRHVVSKSGAALHLTPKEFDLMEYLMHRAGIPVRHQDLLRAIWGPDYGGEVEYLRTFVRQLRKKIEPDPANPRYLTTIPFVGYRFESAP
jgi:two-component system KDP operon response regulator KdpE